MKNPFTILKALRHVRRPSRVVDMPAITDHFWLRKGYAALTFFGTIVTATKEEADKIDCKGNALKTHEMIHLRQAQATHDSWLLFYWLYGWYYLMALPQNRHMKNAAYYLNPFEMEAYEMMYDEGYLERCAKDGANGWRAYARMKPSERLKKVRQILR